MVAAEQESRHNDGHNAGMPVAQWIHDGMSIERTQVLTIALLKNHREHPLQETWESITMLHDTLNLKLEKFRERQREIYPRLTLSAVISLSQEGRSIRSYDRSRAKPRTGDEQMSRSATSRNTTTQLG
ncbi:hypothetical protein C8F04DRAFT_1248749 [Mycena alexandri]|uniref:Uncharacterized protein n=1 Tax=Mycena alexandri TaxID=1745969 RepID=A0AAD6TJD9_9AGAR|nr:hypothetical protein C8F04DRAFT_1248749 [Mycena alexandri]